MNSEKCADPSLPPSLADFFQSVEAGLTSEFFGREVQAISPGLEYQLASGGKRLRPMLTLWMARQFGFNGDAMPFALATELLHNLLLIHDDIEDGDTYRRGRKTLWAEYGIENALNVGDYIIAEAYRCVGQQKGAFDSQAVLFDLFTNTLRTTVEGQALDLSQRADENFTLEKYEEIIIKKTGRYLAMGWVGAALVAGIAPEETKLLWQIGESLGPAFQIRDDLLDLTSAKGRGAELCCDIREGKPSILFAHALQECASSPEDKAGLLRVMSTSRAETSEQDIQWVLELYKRLGSLDYAQGQARDRATRGIELIDQIPFSNPKASSEFAEIANYLIQRKV